MKVLTFVSLLFMPPTLISGIFGMNVKLPLLDSNWDFVLVIAVMLLSVFAASFVFKKRKMMN